MSARRRFASVFALALSATLLASCALSPQQVTLKPDLAVLEANVGHDRAIHVLAEDRRESPVIGSRGGVYSDTSTIEVGNDAKAEIAQAVSGGLARWGFRPALNSLDATLPQFTVVLKSLTFSTDDNAALGKTHAAAAVTVEVDSQGRHFRGTYEANNDVGYLAQPSELRNQTQINEVVSMALQKIFEDKDLVRFLQE